MLVINIRNLPMRKFIWVIVIGNLPIIDQHKPMVNAKERSTNMKTGPMNCMHCHCSERLAYENHILLRSRYEDLERRHLDPRIYILMETY